jgi:acetylornithine deacetylase/succinyl-diaminopimelate desuccinylase-like protein
MPEHPELFPPNLNQPDSRDAAGQAGRLKKIDDRLDRRISRWLKLGRSGPDLLAEGSSSGWQINQTGNRLFGLHQGSGPASLLVYIPSTATPAGRYNLAALLAAAEAWQTAGAELPLTLKFLSGPLDGAWLREHSAELAADALIYAQGEYRQGRPLISLGLKGLLEVELRVTTMSRAAPSAYSEIMPAASWTLVQAIAALKSDSQEIQIENFEDNLAPLPAEESQALLKAAPDFSPELAQRLKDYGLSGYIFNLSDRLVLQTQFMVPTVNVAALECGSFGRAGRLKLPATARARLDFHLVPYQDPGQVFESLKAHLLAQEFGPLLEVTQLPGALRPSRTPMSAPFVQAALAAAESAAGMRPPLVAPISLFSGPLALLKEALGSPPAVCGGLGPGSGRVSRADFRLQAGWLAHLLPLVLPDSLHRSGEALPDWPNPAFENLPDPLTASPESDEMIFELPDLPPGEVESDEMTFELPDLPDLSDLSILIPDLPELENDPFGAAPESKPGNRRRA